MKLKAASGIMLTLLLLSMLTLAFNFKSVKSDPQPPETTKLSISPAVITDPGFGESFTVDINIENVTEFAGWQIGLQWDPTVLQCLSFTPQFGVGTFLGPSSDWMGIEGMIDNTNGRVYPPYAYAFIGTAPPSGSGNIAQVEFQVSGYGFTWINLTEVMIESNREIIPVDVVNGSGSFELPPQHDLAVKLDAPSFLETGSSSLLNATVLNNGLSNEIGVELQLLINGAEVGSVVIPELLSGSSYTLSHLWAPTIVETYNLTAYAPPVLGENIVVNNLVSRIVRVRQRAQLSIIPTTIIGPPPYVGENFTVDIYIQNIINLTGWQIGLAWNASVLQCLSWTTLFNTTVMGPSKDYIEITGMINNAAGEVYPPYSCSIIWWGTPKSGSGSLARIEFRVLDYGSTWINLTEVMIESNRQIISVDLTNGTFKLPVCYQLTVNSSPIIGITFTINGTTKTTPYTELLPEGSYTLVMPQTHKKYVWSHWLEDGDANRIKTVTLNTSITLTAVFSLDITPPTISIVSPENNTYPVEDVPLTFTVSESTSWMGYSLDGQMNVTISGNATLVGLSDGSHTITVYANDTVGNMGSSGMVYFTVDTVSPNIKILSPENKTYATSSVPLSFTLDEATSWIGYSLDGQANVTITGNITLSDLSEGLHHVVVYANDTVGNMGVSNTVYFTIDTIAPSISIVSPKNKTYTVNDVPLTFTVSESTSWMGYSLDGQANITITGNTTLTGLNDGTHSLVVYASDIAGNMSSSDIVYFTIDATPPSISIVSPENKTYAKTDIRLTFTVDEPVLWRAYSLDGQANVTFTGNTTLSGLSDGSHSLIVYAKDTAGNIGASEIIYFSVESMQPKPEPEEPLQLWIAAVIVIIAVVGAALMVYFTKVKKTTEKVK